MSLTIDDPPRVNACSTCMHPILWLYSFRTGRIFSAVAMGNDTLRVHGCKELQEPATWRDLRRGDPPNPTYLEAREQLTRSEEQT